MTSEDAPARKAVPPEDAALPACPHAASAPLDRDGHVVRVRSVQTARAILQERHRTRQAGFTAEFIPQGVLRHHPILMSDGPLHDEQRRKTARFFAPAVIARRHSDLMAATADELLCEASRTGEMQLDDLALIYSVTVTAEVVGLTESPVAAMAARLTTFFNQPPLDITRPDLGRTRRQWMLAAVNGLVPVFRFYLRDVRPAIRSRRRTPCDDVITHLISEGYTDADIAVECVTFGTAGMVTTREFICMAAWHLLCDAALRQRYLAADQPGRLAVLNEIMRLEPVVGHLYRRVIEPFTVPTPDGDAALQAGDLVDIRVRDTNVDPDAVGADPQRLYPGRPLTPGLDASGLSFSHGAHKCPGQSLALLETDALLVRLLAMPVELDTEPDITWDDLIAGYALRGMRLRVG